MTKKPGRKIITFDWAIKTILRDKANFDVLEGFLTALFDRPITILDLLESESNQSDEADKYNRVDVLAKTGDGERILVEMQYLPEGAYLRRLAYGTAKTIVENLKLGESYDNVKKVYSVSFLYFSVNYNVNDDYIYHGKTEFTGFHTHHPVELRKFLVGDRMRINETNVFPEYYLIPLRSFPNIVQDNLDEWIYAFKNNEVLDEFTAPGIVALKEKFDYLKLSETERRRFDKHMSYIGSEGATVDFAEYEREEAREEGIELGIEQGIKQGIEQGAHQKAMEIARVLKQKGWSSAQIAEVTGQK
ncbi:MAG: Rpn family recombination-promoting nuclease/putative transposase [Gammaproteobacteria bacterium]|nr:Rpn family recombination-promoting nuclease/putative transposase [Gammaproteobacteria bacterium]